MSSSKRVAEYAKSNRSACKKCKQKLDKGELRIGVVFTKGDAEMTSWYHPACMPQPKKEVLEAESIEGYDTLEPKDKASIDEMCGGSLKSAAKKPRLSADDPPSSDPNCGEPGFAEAWTKYASMPIPALKEFLDVNRQVKTGPKPELVSLCVDGDLHGALPDCPMCEKGRLRRCEKEAGSFECRGHYSETLSAWVNCGYKAQSAQLRSQRHRWRQPHEGKRESEDGGEGGEGKGEAKGEAKLDASEFEGLDRRAAAARLVELARAQELSLPDDEPSALIAAGTALQATIRDDGDVDPAAALKELKRKFPRKVQKELKCRNEKNATICTLLKEYADLVQNLEDGRHAAASTRKAVSGLMNLEYEIKEGKTLIAKATKVDGVGKGTADKIDEILATGTFAKLEELRAKEAQR